MSPAARKGASPDPFRHRPQSVGHTTERRASAQSQGGSVFLPGDAATPPRPVVARRTATRPPPQTGRGPPGLPHRSLLSEMRQCAFWARSYASSMHSPSAFSSWRLTSRNRGESHSFARHGSLNHLPQSGGQHRSSRRANRTRVSSPRSRPPSPAARRSRFSPMREAQHRTQSIASGYRRCAVCPARRRPHLKVASRR